MTARTWTWNTDSAPEELHRLLRALGEEYPLLEGPDFNLSFRRTDGGFSVAENNGVALVSYGKLSEAGRAIGDLLSGLATETSGSPGSSAFSTLGIVLDCGHNATVTPEHFRKWLRRLALLGFDTAMVYTEAGYSLPDEPCFGYMRGAYTEEELRDLDDYAAGLGIEMIGCIQALGHLEQALKWPAYSGIRDTDHILLVGDPRTYELVEKMVAFWGSVFRSRRLHLGMDETYDLGRGRYIEANGYKPGLEIYSEHLRRTCDICREHGLRPMIWSDVLFRLAGGYRNSNYASDADVPESVRDALPRDLELVYWDYYHDDPAHYADRVRRHRELGSEPIMASGVSSWPTPWHDWRRTENCGGACIEACRDAGVKEMLFTMWSDDGAYWDVDSSLAGLTYVAERCFGDGTVDEDVLARRFQAVCGSDLSAHRMASRINDKLKASSLLWDDPMCAMYLRHVSKEGADVLRDAGKHYREIAEGLTPYGDDAAAGDLGHAALIAAFMGAKVDLAARLFAAYDTGDRSALAVVREEVAVLVELSESLGKSFRKRWLACCKPFGLEVLQIRFAGQAARYRELATRLEEFLAGDVETIPELDEARKGAYLPLGSGHYRALATGARVF